jgi:D-glycero-alpha-D-manno-heptose-7-phosphate kinase
MIISRTPLRMSFVGGGSDMAVFYREHGGAVLSTAIDKYVYVNLNKKFDGGTRIAYSKTEEVSDVAEIEHRLVRQTFALMNIEGGLEITTIADIPSKGTGLGSSSSFTVGLINALSAFKGRHMSADDLGKLSCIVEIEKCGEPIGKQDQYAAAFGGMNLIEFNRDDTVVVTPILLSKEDRSTLERRIIVFYTGMTRSASAVLKEQSAAVVNERTKQDALKEMVRLAYRLRDDLGRGDISTFGPTLHENWELKKSLTSGVSSSQIDEWYDRGRAAGAEGGKILGAGSGGFLMFFAPEDAHNRIAGSLHFLRRVTFGFDPLGSRIIFYNPTS